MSIESNGLHSGEDLKEIGVRPDRLSEDVLKEIIRLLGFPDLVISDLHDWLTKMNEGSGCREVLLGGSESESAPSPRLPRVAVVMHSQEEVLQALKCNQETVEALRNMARHRTRMQTKGMRHPEDAFPERDLMCTGETLNPTQEHFMSKLNEALGVGCSAPHVLTEEWMAQLIRAFYPKQEGSPSWNGRIRRVFSGDKSLHLSGKKGLMVFELPAASETFGSLRTWMQATIPEDYKALTDEKEELSLPQLVGLAARFGVQLDSSEQSALGDYLKGGAAEIKWLKKGLKKFLQASGTKAVLVGEKSHLDAATQELLDELDQEDVKPYFLIKAEERSSLGVEIMRRVLRLPIPERGEAHEAVEKFSVAAVEKQFQIWDELLEMALESSLDVEVVLEKETPDTLTAATKERVFRAVRREGALEMMALYAACLLPHQGEHAELGERIRKLLPEGMALPEIKGGLNPSHTGVPMKQLEKHVKAWEETGLAPFSVGWEEVEEMPALAAEALINKRGESKIYVHEGEVYKVEARGLTEAQRRYRKKLEELLGSMDVGLEVFSTARIQAVEAWEPEVWKRVRSLEEDGDLSVLDLLKCTPEQRVKLQYMAKKGDRLVLLCMDPFALDESALGHIAQTYFSEKMGEFTVKAVLEANDPAYIQALQNLKNALRLVELGLDYKKAIPLIRAEVDGFFATIGMTMDEWIVEYESEDNHVHIDDSVGVLLQWALAVMIQKAKEAADDHNLVLAKEAHPFIHKMWKFLKSKINKERGVAFEDEYSFVMAETAEEMARIQLDAIRLGVQGSGWARLAPLEALRADYLAMSCADRLPQEPERALQPLLQLYFDFTEAYIQGNFVRCKELFAYAFNESSIPYEEQFRTLALPGRWPAVAEQGGFPCFIKFNTKANDLAWKMALMTMEAARRTQDRPMFDRAIGVFKAASGKPAPYVQANYLREIGHWELENGGVERCDVQVANRAYRQAAQILERRDPRDPKRVDFLNFSAETRRIEALQHIRVHDELRLSKPQESMEALRGAIKASFAALELLNRALELNPESWVYKISHFQAVFRIYCIYEKCAANPALQENIRMRALEQGEDLAAIFEDVQKLESASQNAQTLLLAQGGGTVKAYAGEIGEEFKTLYSGQGTIIHALIASWEALKSS